MTIRDLYQFVIEKGFELDPRGPDALRRQMSDARAEYDSLDARERLLFDTERFVNPFGDTRILCGDPDTEVKRLVCGIDIDGAEIVMADAMRHHGRPVDLVVAHHASASGGGVGSRRDTMWPQVQMLTDFGVPADKAEKLIRRSAEGDQRSSNFRLNQIADALEMPLMTIHSPGDLHLFREGERILAEDKPATVGDLVDICDSWPEVRWLLERGKGTEIAVGDRRDPLGKTYYCFYGGWNPTPEVFELICDAGCGTLWVLATDEALNEVARRRDVSIVVVPHWPADNLGLNMLLDQAMTHFGEFDVVPVGNYVWYNRRARAAD
jgi:hypothetical protein